MTIAQLSLRLYLFKTVRVVTVTMRRALWFRREASLAVRSDSHSLPQHSLEKDCTASVTRSERRKLPHEFFRAASRSEGCNPPRE